VKFQSQTRGHRTGVAGADGASVNADDGHHRLRGGGDESLLRGVGLIEAERPLDQLDSFTGERIQKRRPSDAGKNIGP
jgi:hypothetical protein